ncbi:Cytochrome c oxidase subunit CcoP [Thioalkalivibrio nitratireducens DSM 14787]|uniref:Cbb3-type cytochrome c oxidase subunit n=1 Tax=Thioalkalivibrio nitratireducens (strain DSM 14787 / UNIQEM 213 / ALEN2) TaxID=1255043 RepID=L0DSE2_THIND|nr:cytochrome-c oxidase, cbb3-type subunit III [Thioalkalivibrio nitratireducens]AGA31907.1 Cytochrome c oxidase subunit CcoP [Thioalkalivibrio nitratireducens DSM 14787]
MSTNENPSKKPGEVETTGHVWDANLQEYNNPLPRWWLWGFYATVVFAVVYWILYPAWPVGDTFTKGLNTVTFMEDGEERTMHWNTRALLTHDMQSGKHAVRQREMLERVGEMDYDTILADVDAMSFVNAYAKGSFGTWCAACHQTGGAGVIGLYPNLRNDQWKWGGTVAEIEETLVNGRLGYMPGYRETLNSEQLEQVASYVLSLNNYDMDGDPVAAGAEIFTGHLGGCFQCHGMDAQGLTSQGAPNLSNNLWALVDVPGAADDEERVARVAEFVRDGIQREMPAFADRLSPTEIRVLTAYVHSLGGGQ